MEFTEGTFDPTLTSHKICAHEAGVVAAGERRLVTCQTKHVGKHVFVHISGMAILTLCEVEVFALPGKSLVLSNIVHTLGNMPYVYYICSVDVIYR